MRPTTVASWAITSFPVPDEPSLVLTWPALFGRIHRVVPFETCPSCIYSRVSFRNSVERRPDVPFSLNEPSPWEFVDCEGVEPYPHFPTEATGIGAWIRKPERSIASQETGRAP